MLKYIAAVAVMTVAGPLYAQGSAQETDASHARADAPQKAATPDKAVPATTTPGTPSAVPPAQTSKSAAATTATPPAAPVKTIEGVPQTPARQVAAIVSREFAAYDANRSGRLEKEEFARWMAALKAHAPASEPGESVSKPWTEAAFKQANTSGSGAVSREELTAFFIGAKSTTAGG
ncbi:MAG: EF-hand domain-containing protein [Sphingomonas adhaesiva]|uniref:EF-hand domain-containing protein n=1 Tax=Sphingomonas adhaesiva TaxID=28212 RepID=UPI002FF640CC